MDDRDFARALESQRAKLQAWLSRRFLASDVPDLVQETLLQCWKNREEYDPTQEIGGWVHYRMRTVAYASHKRARVRERAAPLLHEDDVAPSTPERDVSMHETDSLLLRILDSLPVQEREMVAARFFDELSIREVAASFGRTEDAVDAALRRVNKKMREALQRVGVEDARRGAVLPFLVEGLGGAETEDDAQGARPTPVSTSIPPALPSVGPTMAAWEPWARRFAVAAGVVLPVLYLLAQKDAPWANHLALVVPDLRPGAGVVPLVTDPLQPHPTVEPPPICPPSQPPPRTLPCPADDTHKNAGPRSLGRAAATALDRGDTKSAAEACRLAGPGNVFCRELQSLHP
ncbi:sigma-70 family RNA polymerase sigma factor [Polyangium jinanense]|uniref:Sigma-70 family RNA polymerase sigma factor n=1 Tax=Polyangium jinanense TaxID=2829994 RepID=A0A9X3X8A8_9BACT|nr:sigma-70 family RNA polymerase sigma factor [Polyangium jinanense]MDC3955847.1 sigma-70 family RNA polymerase sigma factor [Polyangium jinanense]MDC3983206.1 sigma-70 family RNA polymerase sigma factor [Polyangium jinanense]